MSRCKDCDADLIWAVTENDKKIPLDAEPSEDGKFELVGSDPPTAVWVHPDERHRHFDGLYTAHFDTCSFSGVPRKRGRR